MPRERTEGARVLAGPDGCGFKVTRPDGTVTRRVIVVGTDGRRRSKNFGGASAERLARGYAEKQAGKVSQLEGVTVGEAIRTYMTERLGDEERNRPSGMESTGYRLESMFGPVMTGRLMLLTAAQCLELYVGKKDVRGKRVGDGLVTRHTKKKKPPSVAYHHGILAESKTFLDWCVGSGMLVANPMTAVVPVGQKERGKPQLNGDQTHAFINAAMSMILAGDQSAVAGLLALVLGLRASEVVNLTPSKLDEGASVVCVVRGKTRRSTRRLRLPLETPVGELLRASLRGLAMGKRPAEPVFAGDRGPRRRRWVYEASMRICRVAGVPEVSAHGLRGTHLTLAEEEGTSSSNMVRSAGHDRAVQLQDYVRGEGAQERGTQKKFIRKLALVREATPDAPEMDQPIVWRQRGVHVKGGK